MKAFHSVVSTRTLRSLAVIGMVGAVLLSAVPTIAVGKPLPPVESGDPTDTDYGPSPKKTTTISTLNTSLSGGKQTIISDKSHYWRWLSYLITVSWRHSALR